MKQTAAILALGVLALFLFWEFYHADQRAKQLHGALMAACEASRTLSPAAHNPHIQPNPTGRDSSYFVARDRLHSACLQIDG